MVNGHGLLRNTKISAEIDRMREEKLSEKKLSAHEVLQKYIDIAFADITDFVVFGSVEADAMNELDEPILDDEGEKITYLRNFVNFMKTEEVDGSLITEVKNGKMVYLLS